MRIATISWPYIVVDCKIHSNCKHMMNARLRYYEKWIACLEFLDKAQRVTEAEHKAEMQNLKKSFGIKVRE